MGKVSRPLLQYHGSKFRLAPWIISHFPPHRVYVEPYGGGGAVLLRKEPVEVEVWNDLNDDVTNLFQVLRDKERAPELLRLIALTPYSRREHDLSFVPCEEPVERARRLVVRSWYTVGNDAASNWRKTGFKTYADVDKDGGGLGVRTWGNYPAALVAIIERLQGRVIIENRDALKIIRRYDDVPSALFYCDPPYPIETRADAGADYSHEMTSAEHRAMADALKSVKGKVALSGYPCPLYEELFGDWHRVECETMADGKIRSKAKRTEVLWMNYDYKALLAETERPTQAAQLTMEFEA